jgi:EAP30/Vps36 family
VVVAARALPSCMQRSPESRLALAVSMFRVRATRHARTSCVSDVRLDRRSWVTNAHRMLPLAAMATCLKRVEPAGTVHSKCTQPALTQAGSARAQVCRATRPRNGGLIELRELTARVVERRGSAVDAVSPDDVLQARRLSSLNTLVPIAYRMLPVG